MSTTKRERGSNKDQFLVWSAAYEVYNLHHKVYHDRHESKEFWKLVATKTGYEIGSFCNTAANNYIRKWVEAYVTQTGPDNTVAANLDYHGITKQKREHQRN